MDIIKVAPKTPKVPIAPKVAPMAPNVDPTCVPITFHGIMQK